MPRRQPSSRLGRRSRPGSSTKSVETSSTNAHFYLGKRDRRGGAKYQIACDLTRAASSGTFRSLGRRSVCYPLDAAAIAERIAAGETTAGDAWRAYAATAVRPYARATFAGALSRARARTAPSTVPVEPTPDSSRSGPGLPIAVSTSATSSEAWRGDKIRKRAGADPVLVVGPDAALRVRGGALDVEHGSGKDRVHVRIDVDGAEAGATSCSTPMASS